MTELNKTNLDRRTLVKGAAWSAPVLAAAVAAPLAAATDPVTPDCPNCMKPNVGAFSIGSGLALASNSQVRLTMAAVNSISATDCGFLTNIFRAAFTFIVTKATLTMSDGATYQSDAGLGTAAGVLGTPLNPFPGAFSFPNVRIDPDNNRGSLPFGAVPRTRPSKLTVDVEYTLEYGIGLQLQCPNTYEWDLSSAVSVSRLINGSGVASYTGVSTAL